MKIKIRDVPRFLKYIYENRSEIYDRFKIKDKTDLVGATVAMLNREEKNIFRTVKSESEATKKLKEDLKRSQTLSEPRHAVIRHETKTDDSILPAAIVAAAVISMSDSASADSSSSDSFSAGDGNFDGGGSDSSW